MMKTKLFIRMLWFLTFAFFLHSCRHDLLQTNDEHYNNKSEFQLTSKKISLKESRHKDKITPILEKTTSELKKFKSLSFAKTVNYNDISINTENVIYIENGPNYHTYTFLIERNNSLGNEPLENLLLSPLPDGSYQEFLITYNLTPQEKLKLQNGYTIDTKGKTTIVELAKGTFNGSGQLAKTVCGWTTETYWIPCSGEYGHDGSNFHECPYVKNPSQGTPPQAYSVAVYKCIEEVDEHLTPDTGTGTSGGGSGGSGGSGSGDGGSTTTECTQIPNSPQTPTLTDENGCSIGAPTLPNIERPKNPCDKVKEITDETTDLKDKITNLNKTDSLNLNYEKGAIITENANGQTQLKHKNGTPNSTFIQFLTPETGEAIIIIHTHFDAPDMLPTFSFEDVISFDAIHFFRKQNNKTMDKIAMYLVTKSGVFNMIVENSDLFYNMGGQMLTDKQEEMKKEFYGDIPEKVNVTPDEVIKQVAKSLPKYGIGLYKATNDDLDSWKKLTVNPTTDELEEKPCN